MWWAASLCLLAALAGCLGDPGREPASSSPGPSAPASSSSRPAAAGPAPAWNFTLPPLPNETAGPANGWHRGGGLDPAWNATAGTGPGLYQLVWWVGVSQRDPPPGYACGVGLSTRTDFDVVHHAVRTAWDPFVPEGAVALVSSAHRDASTSCDGKQHLSVLANGSVVDRHGSPWPTQLPFEVLPNGTVHVLGTDLWLAAGQTAEFRTDRWENRSATAASSATSQPPPPDSIHSTGFERIIHLGAWDRDRVWVEGDVCGDGPDRSRNCIGSGHGP